jgi:hypothetical protein
MRLPVSRATALVAIVAALVTATGIAPARTGPGGRDRDRVLRVARAGPQRLESPDGPIHCHEETDAVSVPAGDVINVTGHADGPPGSGSDQQAPLAVLAASPVPTSPDFPPDIRPEPRRPLLPYGELELHAPDRAPPAA